MKPALLVAFIAETDVIYHDVQNQTDLRGLSIDNVGIRDLRYPIRVLDREFGFQSTLGSIALSVDLPDHARGTHMSRFIEVLNLHHQELTVRTIPTILSDLKGRLHAESARISVRFPYFLKRAAPVTGAAGWLDYSCHFAGFSNGKGDDFRFGVRVPVTSLCPCSKAISDYGAHNQRGYVQVEVRSVSDTHIWIEEVIETVEACASSPVYPLLKRPDERYVTMQAYENPAFVEDIVRAVCARLKDDERLASFRVRAVNHESIHNHSAFAAISWARSSSVA